MDGNRRWAKEHGSPELMGHKRVSDDIIEPLIEHAADIGIRYMTFWAWSTENWGRKPEEVAGIMNIFRRVIKKDWRRLGDKGVKIQTIGDISKFPKDIEQSLKKVVENTQNNKRITAVFALNYGGRDEILRSIKRLVGDILNANINREKLLQQCNNVTIEQFNNHLDTKDIPDPELIIRTGGEQRLSGFLLWQSEYSELYFPSFYMPDFTPEKLDEAIEEYQKRKRRFGV
jgi:undecaprenyl diphosphate synthase